ncbi:type IV secretion system protein VirB4, partial [Burkholderia multivorans]
SYDISQLGPELRTFGMMVILEQLWRRVVANRYTKKRTWVYIDEFHLLFSNPYSAEYFKTFYKRARKYGAAPTGITQDIEELLDSPDARLMLANSKYLYLLGQSKTNADILSQLLGLSDDQTKYVLNVAPGTGLIKSGNAIVPVDGRMPTGSDLFTLYDTKFEE